MQNAAKLVTLVGAIAVGAAPALVSCKQSPAAPGSDATAITSDAALFALVTEREPFTAYSLFPNAAALNASDAHRPVTRVSLNATALAALQNGKLPSGKKFPNGSIIFKDIRTAGGASLLYSVMYKQTGNPLAGSGWLWAEFSPTGSVAYSIENRGTSCTTCHSFDGGLHNDLVRTFERQR